ncbi:class I SAM-dependent DNA methyltransferase [Litoreibacter roseus]|uniref:class I SAM-dependent DNA methyltransferase n=1 Tax=Litoreibacter roseus TaxID=2601869 RepID=UPI0013586EF6|nr:class I SAM-dependent methyltransferase [Litoreibacter roseus]
MTDKQTIDAYNTRVNEYAELTQRDRPGRYLKRFMDRLAPSSHVLDLGCGPGQASVHLLAAGHQPDPVDASAEMVNLANRESGLNARQATFDDMSGHALYDGVWANFSLLHVQKSDFPRHLSAVHGALKPGGLFHIGMKLGAGEKRDRLDRFYSYYLEDELLGHLRDAGFAPDQIDKGEEMGLAGDIDPWIMVLSNA